MSSWVWRWSIVFHWDWGGSGWLKVGGGELRLGLDCGGSDFRNEVD